MPRTVTIIPAVSDRQVKNLDELVAWANKEAIPTLRALRGYANAEIQRTYTITTAATGAWTTLWASDAVRAGESLDVFARVRGDATAGPAQSVTYHRIAKFRNNAGVVTQIGATQAPLTLESTAAPDVQFVIAGTTVLLQVQDDAASTYVWTAWISILPPGEG